MLSSLPYTLSIFCLILLAKSLGIFSTSKTPQIFSTLDAISILIFCISLIKVSIYIFSLRLSKRVLKCSKKLSCKILSFSSSEPANIFFNFFIIIRLNLSKILFLFVRNLYSIACNCSAGQFGGLQYIFLHSLTIKFLISTNKSQNSTSKQTFTKISRLPTKFL